MDLSVGKRRGLATCSTDQGVFSILALDHRNNLKKEMNAENPDSIAPEAISKFKKLIIKNLGGKASAVLLDPIYGAAKVISNDSLDRNTGLIVSLEETGYSGDPTARKSKILKGWSVGKISRMGASALKLLVYYHPDTWVSEKQEALIKSVAEYCYKYDLAFFLESLSYSPDPAKKLSSSQKKTIVLRSIERLTSFNIDILKAEFPLDINENNSEQQWRNAYREVSQVSRVPWVLLSAGINFDTYLNQLTLACENGASGAMVGRAVWKEAVGLNMHELNEFLLEEASQRMIKITNICNGYGKPWYEFYPPKEVPDDWYKTYIDL